MINDILSQRRLATVTKKKTKKQADATFASLVVLFQQAMKISSL